MDYDGFLTEHSSDSHRVFGIVRSPHRSVLREVTVLTQAFVAVRLADALNSRIAGRRNHHARLTAAVHDLPDPVHAFAFGLPEGSIESAAGLLVDDLTVEPIDGFLLFPLPGPLDERNPTPRAARALARRAEFFAEQCLDATSPRARCLTDLSIESCHGLRDRLGAALQELASSLTDGLPAPSGDVADDLALRLALCDISEMDIAEDDLLPHHPSDDRWIKAALAMGT